MSKLKEIFLAGLDENDIHYVNIDPEAEDSRILTITYGMADDEPPESVKYWIVFDKEDQQGFEIHCTLTKVPEAKVSDCYALCNEINSSYRFIKVFVDEDRDFEVIIDGKVNEDCVYELIRSYISLLNDLIPSIVYPKLMKTIWA